VSRYRTGEPPAVLGLQQFARFSRWQTAAQQEHYYLLALQPTLLGELAVVRSWGAIGTQGARLTAIFADREQAQPTVTRVVRRRLQQRYELVAWQ
jgi:predicted DNA-binding WGR domain protein